MARRKNEDRVELGEITATPMQARGVRDGKQYWRARGPSPERATLWTGWETKAGVEAIVAELHRKGVPAQNPSTHVGAVRSVGDLLDRWEAHQRKRYEGKQIALATISNYNRACRNWAAVLGDVGVRKLTRAMVEDALTAWVAGGVAVRSAKGNLDALAACVAWGAARDLCEAVPLGRMSVLTIRDDEFVGVSTTPTQPQVAAVIRELDGWYRDLVTLQALTGARVGEIAALHVRDWDRAAGTLTLSGRDDEREKRGKARPRRFPVMGELGRVLLALVQQPSITTRPSGAMTGEVHDGDDEADDRVLEAGSPPGPADSDQRGASVPRQVPHAVDVGGAGDRGPLREPDPRAGVPGSARRDGPGVPPQGRGRVADRQDPDGVPVAERGPDERLVQITARRYAAQLARHLTAACEAAGVPVFTTHGIRRLVVEELLERENARRVAELTGHSVVVLLRRYVRPTSEQLRDVVARAGLTAVEPRDNVRQLRARQGEEE